MKRNATGHIVDLTGVSALMLDWLALRYKFKFNTIFLTNVNLEMQYGFLVI